MKYELYADVWFATNFIMDSIALWICGKLMKQKIRVRRVILGSLLGTTGSILFFFFLKSYTFYLLLVHLVINPVMVFICFRSRRWKEFLAQWFFTYLVVIFMGGILEFSMGMWNSTIFYWIAVLGAVALIFLAEEIESVWKRKRETVFELLILTGREQISARGFFDTGNLLRDPLVNRPVHILKRELLEKELEEGKLSIRLIPFHSLGTENGLLETVTLEGMYILKEEVPIYLEKPVFGIAREQLFQSNDYDVILNGTCMKQ